MRALDQSLRVFLLPSIFCMAMPVLGDETLVEHPVTTPLSSPQDQVTSDTSVPTQLAQILLQASPDDQTLIRETQTLGSGNTINWLQPLISANEESVLTFADGQPVTPINSVPFALMARQIEQLSRPAVEHMLQQINRSPLPSWRLGYQVGPVGISDNGSPRFALYSPLGDILSLVRKNADNPAGYEGLSRRISLAFYIMSLEAQRYAQQHNKQPEFDGEGFHQLPVSPARTAVTKKPKAITNIENAKDYLLATIATHAPAMSPEQQSLIRESIDALQFVTSSSLKAEEIFDSIQAATTAQEEKTKNLEEQNRELRTLIDGSSLEMYRQQARTELEQKYQGKKQPASFEKQVARLAKQKQLKDKVQRTRDNMHQQEQSKPALPVKPSPEKLQILELEQQNKRLLAEISQLKQRLQQFEANTPTVLPKQPVPDSAAPQVPAPPPPPPLPTQRPPVPPPLPPLPGANNTSQPRPVTLPKPAPSKPPRLTPDQELLKEIREGTKLKPATDRTLPPKPVDADEALLDEIRNNGKDRLKPAEERELAPKPDTSTPRDRLLDEIRSRNGRPVERNTPEKTPEQPEPEQGGDLESVLKQALKDKFKNTQSQDDDDTNGANDDEWEE